MAGILAVILSYRQNKIISSKSINDTNNAANTW